MPSIYDSAAGYNNRTGTSQGSTNRGVYGNLPPGMYNAGGTAGNNAYVRNTNPNQLVSTGVSSLLDDPNSAYMRNARQNGMNVAGSRGLLNSSIAAGNSQRAAIDAALPIAQGDAAAYQATESQNQDALNAILAQQMGNETSLGVANIGAGAQMYGDNLGLMNSRENRAFDGEQNGLGRSFTDYMSQLNHSQGIDRDNNTYHNNLGLGAFNLGGDLARGSQQFRNSVGRDALNNPAIMGNPQGLGNYMNWIDQPFSNQMDQIFGGLFGGQGGRP